MTPPPALPHWLSTRHTRSICFTNEPPAAVGVRNARRQRPVVPIVFGRAVPCGIAPYPGAETGTGGRIRDGHATGRGSLIGAATAAYCVGNLNIPGCGGLPALWLRRYG